MSVAAMEADGVGQLLAERVKSSALETLDAPWSVSVSDFVYPRTTGERPPDLAQRLQYSRALLRLPAQEAAEHKLLVEVTQLLKPQSGSGVAVSPRP
jgi:hypothetical protein